MNKTLILITLICVGMITACNKGGGDNNINNNYNDDNNDRNLVSPITQICPNGLIVAAGTNCPTTNTITCPDGSILPIGDTCPTIETRICPDGSTVLIGQNCSSPNVRLCSDGTSVPISEQCPTVEQTTCPDGSTILVGHVCPTIQTCWDGSIKEPGTNCPIQTKQCENGDMIPVTQNCPEPTNPDIDANGLTDDNVRTRYSGTFAGFVYDNSNNNTTYGSWGLTFRTTNNISRNSDTDEWNIDVVGNVSGLLDVPGCSYTSELYGYISSDGLLDVALNCNGNIWIEAQFSNNYYAASGPVYFLVNNDMRQIAKFNGGHNDWSIDVNGVSKDGLANMFDTLDGIHGVLSASDTLGIVPGTLSSNIVLPNFGIWNNTYTFINFSGEYVDISLNDFRSWNGGENSYFGYAWNASTTPTNPSVAASKVVVLYKSNGEILLYSPYDSMNTTYTGRSAETFLIRLRDWNNREQQYYYPDPVPANACHGRTGTISSTSFFGVGERFEGTVNLFGCVYPVQ